MFSTPFDVLVIGSLIALIGLLTLSEYAIVAARRSRLKEWASRGNRGAECALELSEEPDRFLATVRLGVTVIGTLAGAYGAATLAGPVTQVLAGVPVPDSVRSAIGYGLVILGIASVTIICGEVLPKQLAMSRPERVAVWVARPMRLISFLAVPLVRALGVMTQLVLRAFGIQPADEPPVTEEEIKVLLEEGTKAGVFEEAAQTLVERVFRYCDRRAKALMTPRDQIAWIDMSDPPEEIRRKVLLSPHSRFPVCDGSLDNLIGVVEAKNLLSTNVQGEPLRVKGFLSLPLFLYEGTRGLKILEMFRTSTTQVAIVLDEYGAVMGLLTLNDILQALVGDLSDGGHDEATEPTSRDDGSRVLEGRLPLDEFAAEFDLPEIPRGDYDTLAGFVVNRFSHIPEVGESFIWNSLRFEVTKRVGNRVEKVAVAAAPSDETQPEAP